MTASLGSSRPVPLEGELLELAEAAIACCPVEAISLMSDALGQGPLH